MHVNEISCYHAMMHNEKMKEMRAARNIGTVTNPRQGQGRLVGHLFSQLKMIMRGCI
jgi:hypothetical protein